MPGDVEHSANIGVSHAPCKLDLLLEAVERPGVSRYFRPEGLQSYARAELEIFCLIHLSHSAVADETHNLKASRKHITWGECRID